MITTTTARALDYTAEEINRRLAIAGDLEADYNATKQAVAEIKKEQEDLRELAEENEYFTEKCLASIEGLEMDAHKPQSVKNADTRNNGYAQSTETAGKRNRAILVLGEPNSGAETKIFQNGGKLYFRRAVYSPDGSTPGYYTAQIPLASPSTDGAMSAGYAQNIVTLINQMGEAYRRIQALADRVAALEAK